MLTVIIYVYKKFMPAISNLTHRGRHYNVNNWSVAINGRRRETLTVANKPFPEDILTCYIRQSMCVNYKSYMNDG